jgi:hypothetical protein
VCELNIHELIAERRAAMDRPARRRMRRALLALVLLGLLALAAALLTGG